MALGETLGVGAWLVGGVLGAAEEPAGAAFADDHHARAARPAGRRAGVARRVGAAGRATGDDCEAPPAALTARRAIAAEGKVQAAHALPRTGHVEDSPCGSAGNLGVRVAPELAEAVQPGVLPEQFVDEGPRGRSESATR